MTLLFPTTTDFIINKGTPAVAKRCVSHSFIAIARHSRNNATTLEQKLMYLPHLQATVRLSSIYGNARLTFLISHRQLLVLSNLHHLIRVEAFQQGKGTLNPFEESPGTINVYQPF